MIRWKIHSSKDAFSRVLVLEQKARYGCYALEWDRHDVHLQTVWPTDYPGLQENLLQTLIYKPLFITTGHLVALHKEPGDPEFFFFFKPWLLPHLNRCLSLEASACYHRQYCISPYNILLHSTEPRWFINVRAKANMLCVLLELHKCLKSGWVGFGCWSGENRDAWERLAGVLFPAWPQKSFFCSPWKNNWVNILKCLLNGAY